ncbi:hypothetical protein EON65_06730 [archaeon]|nr:MAG: hypothetical protein EON65_06730 [archaeon]
MNEIMRILGFEEIVRDVSTSNAKAMKKADELDSYEALVREAGEPIYFICYIIATLMLLMMLLGCLCHL